MLCFSPNRPKDDVKMKATDAKAECERLETEIAKVGGLFNVLPSDIDTWIGVNLVTKDATRMYHVSFQNQNYYYLQCMLHRIRMYFILFCFSSLQTNGLRLMTKN